MGQKAFWSPDIGGSELERRGVWSVGSLTLRLPLEHRCDKGHGTGIGDTWEPWAAGQTRPHYSQLSEGTNYPNHWVRCPVSSKLAGDSNVQPGWRPQESEQGDAGAARAGCRGGGFC